MWNPFRKAREARAQEQERFLQALTLIADQFTTAQEVSFAAVEKIAAANEAQANALSAHLALFRVTEAPISRVMRDEDEFAAEMARFGLIDEHQN